ncbi:uncharacterized protein BXIN_2548 [Babesia sp. Xinjiang]|uniref:uncharacterized protein n=1 Tax=Babesia sp. Xinjiang TaxID=462227 RepID=UPI000A2431D9|nr:uncharacterized protein BXIN_2548 [Babesia sp. Xinjiang]ORM41466.1 hypothetical protein BXIN_2548 [Babesia sp. Xinjiang]
MTPVLRHWVAIAALLAVNYILCANNTTVTVKIADRIDRTNPSFIQNYDDHIHEGDLEDILRVEIPEEEFDKGTPGIDYLGIGYDSIFGNTLGGEETLLDPGYRTPIINFSWRKSSEGYSPSLNAVYPLHGWVRPVYSCGRSSKIQEVDSLDELKKALSASAELKGDVSAASFSASAKYKSEAANIAQKTERIYLHSDMCIRYQAGIPLNIPWDTTDAFKDAVKTLEPLSDEIKQACSMHDILDDLTKKECIPLKHWIKFFQVFGTHYVHQLLLGGKLVQTLKIRATTFQDLKRSGVDVDLAVSSILGSASAELMGQDDARDLNLEEIGAKTITVIGGEMPNTPITDAEYARWGKSVADNPMPIGISADSLKNLLGENIHDSYTLALQKYAEFNGVTYETLIKLGASVGGLMREIKNGLSVVTVNWDFNGAECPKGQKILLGFSLLFNPKGTLQGIIPCKTGAYKCNVPLNKEEIRSISWAICTSGLQPNIFQVADVTKDGEEKVAAKCPHGSVVQFGIKLHAEKERLVKIKPCKKGKPLCKTKTTDKKIAGIWIVCSTESHHADVINLAAGIGGGMVKVKCDEDEVVIGGTTALFKMHKNAVESGKRSMSIKTCERYLKGCEVQCEGECLVALVIALCSKTKTQPLSEIT